MKRGKKLIKISKDEKELLLKEGCKWHSDIHKTYSGHPTYYLTESPNNLKKLEEIRNRK